MTGNRRLRQGVAGRSEAKLGRMVVVSLGLHLLVFLLFAGLILPRFGRLRPPVYYVDLVNLPVSNPQAGRPEVRPRPAKTKPAAEKKAPRPQPAPAPLAKPVTKAPLKTLPPPAKPAPRPRVKPLPAPQPAASYQQTLNAIEAMQKDRERQEAIDKLKARLAELAKDDTRPDAVSAAPVGMPEGHGDQAGVEQRAWLQAFFKANWQLSKYQLPNTNLAARVHVRYDAEGNLLDYKMLKSSGDQAFDDSVKRAVLLDNRLPFRPGRPIDEEIEFNLKDLQE